MSDSIDALVKIVKLVELPSTSNYKGVVYRHYHVVIGVLILGIVEHGDEMIERCARGQRAVLARWTRKRWRWKRYNDMSWSHMYFESRKRSVRELIEHCV